jgi:hypothetical protein
MRPGLFLHAATAAVLAAASARAQQPQTPAELFPAKILVYAEVRQPGELAREIASLFRGSLLTNVPDSLVKLHDKLGKEDPRGDLRGIGAMGLGLCPEVLREVGRIKGAAAALLGIDKSGEPEYLVAVLPGDSQAPTFLLRTYLTMGDVRPVGKAEGVTLYCSVQRVWRRSPDTRPDRGGPRPQPQAPTIREYGPVFAMTPEGVFIGSPEAVKGAIRRVKGKGDGASLAMSETFRQASKEAPDEPGLFTYGEPPALAEILLLVGARGRPAPAGREVFTDDDVQAAAPPEPAASPAPARKAAAPPEPAASPAPRGVPWIWVVAKALNLRAFRSEWRSVTLSKGTLRFRQSVLLDPTQKSIVLDLLPVMPVDTSLLHYVPKDAVLAVALSNSDGAKRWARLLEFVDEIERLAGAGREKAQPSAAVRQIERELGVDFGRDVAGKIRTLGFALGNLQNIPVRKVIRKGPNFESGSFTPEIPALILVQAVDEESARKLTDDFLPKFLRAKGLEPAARDVKGQTLYQLKLGEHENFYYGRHASTIVLGPYEDPVAQALAAGSGKNGWLADAKLATRLKKLHQPVALAIAKPASALLGFVLLRGGGYHKQTATSAPEKGFTPGPVKDTVERGPASLGKEEQQMLKRLGKVLAKEDLLVYSVTRTQERIGGEATLGGLRELFPSLTDFAIEEAMHYYRMAIGVEKRAVEAQRSAEEERRRADEQLRRAENEQQRRALEKLREKLEKKFEKDSK